MCSPAAHSEQFVLTNGKAFGNSVAEFAISGVFYFAKQHGAILRAQGMCEWSNPQMVELSRSTIGVIGLGSIGRAVCEKAKAIGMRVGALRRRQLSSDQATGYTMFYGESGLSELLKVSDFVVVTVPLTDKTNGMIGADQIAQMKPTAVLINVGRGEVIDEDALIAALRAKQLGGAVLEVFKEEPLPPDHGLWGLDNVLVAPHCADNTLSQDNDALEIFEENVRRFVKGQQLTCVVDRTEGY